MRVKRYVLKLTEDPQTVLMPAHARVLTARIEGSQLALYATHGPVQPDVARRVRVIATDTEFEGLPGAYHGTVTHKGTTYHVFEAP